MDKELPTPLSPRKGRGALSNPESRYSATVREPIDDGWSPEERSPLRTTVTREVAKGILSRNASPDIPFELSLNPYRGCEHGCIYCYARPSHAYLGLSPGLDFESRLFVKPDAAALLRKALAREGHVPTPIALGANTDPYQPIERQWRITRQVLEVLHECRHPLSLTTKSALVERDLDLLAALAAQRLVQVLISITTLDRSLARILEPRAAAPQRRLETVRRLSEAGIPVTVLMAPIIPALTDNEIETLLTQAAEAGAHGAGYVMLRLPLELEGLFREWLESHLPLRAQHVLARLRDIHGGTIYRSQFGLRQSGTGAYADLIRQRFRLALKRTGLNRRPIVLDSSQFRPPTGGPVQLDLF
ncbi:PA0069 family radical SAM protein [Candidatus Methylocalor cossyra]|uniref:Radical SAM domain protein n=1 Tax=Candidatus Methylocalor cossyra TaxID=3108543 RepID=A0ABM9NHQ1_9GAMM